MRDVATAQAVQRRIQTLRFDWATECVREVLGPTEGTASEAAGCWWVGVGGGAGGLGGRCRAGAAGPCAGASPGRTGARPSGAGVVRGPADAWAGAAVSPVRPGPKGGVPVGPGGTEACPRAGVVPGSPGRVGESSVAAPAVGCVSTR
ncbi:SLATT domain-containing protein [Streptomyces sp. CBMA291]|uniref:SLATT domain-containing protein n=1 Tax=Streptomyces sp. CBMA291 TaxID=1930279 RepID=UPI001D5EAF57|nr:hypothetical protein [Streptomyces sp. CBMA291]